VPGLLALLLLLLSAAGVRADQPQWSFAGQLPSVFERGQRVPAALYTEEGRVLGEEAVGAIFLFRTGDPVVLIRDGAVAAEARVGEVVASRREGAQQDRLLFFRPAGLPEGVTVPAEPPGPQVLQDAGYDLWVFTDQPVTVLAPDPALQDLPFGEHDYCVRVGRLRFGIVRAIWPQSGEFRGWQVYKLPAEGRPVKVMSDYTWQEAGR
jgi:hypothetical protein